MSQKPNSYDELTWLISALLDGRITAEEHARLESLLAKDAAARKLYLQLVDQEAELPCLVASAQGQAATSRERLHRQNRFQTVADASRSWRRWLAGGAIALGMVVVLFAILVLPGRLSKDRVDSAAPMAPVASIGNSWTEDFESGSSSGWYGRIVTTNLPAGSKYGIVAMMRNYPVGDSDYAIQLPEDWSKGLVAFTEKSTLNVTYRLGNPTHVNVFAHTIPAKPSGRYRMYQLRTGGGFPGKSGRWQTASIPFANFMRKMATEPGGAAAFVGGPPEAGELLTTLSFSSLEPNDLVIDRVWITETGPGREEIVPLRNQTP